MINTSRNHPGSLEAKLSSRFVSSSFPAAKKRDLSRWLSNLSRGHSIFEPHPQRQRRLYDHLKCLSSRIYKDFYFMRSADLSWSASLLDIAASGQLGSWCPYRTYFSNSYPPTPAVWNLSLCCSMASKTLDDWRNVTIISFQNSSPLREQ